MGMKKLGISLALICLSFGRPSASADMLGNCRWFLKKLRFIEERPAPEKFVDYKNRSLEQNLEDANTLQQEVESILLRHHRGEISLKQALTEMRNEDLVLKAGFTLEDGRVGHVREVITSEEGIQGRYFGTPFCWNGHIEDPVLYIKNGLSEFAPQNLPLQKTLLFLMAEERLHAVQFIRTRGLDDGKEAMVSRYLQGVATTQGRSFSEADILARFTELVGYENIPLLVRKSHPEERAQVPRNLPLSPEPVTRNR